MERVFVQHAWTFMYIIRYKQYYHIASNTSLTIQFVKKKYIFYWGATQFPWDPLKWPWDQNDHGDSLHSKPIYITAGPHVFVVCFGSFHLNKSYICVSTGGTGRERNWSHLLILWSGTIALAFSTKTLQTSLQRSSLMQNSGQIFLPLLGQNI